MEIKANQKSGFTLVEVMVVVGTIGLFAVIAIPNFIRARTKAQQNACINNLRLIDGAVQQWALENKKAPDDSPLADGSELRQYLGGAAALPACPAAPVSMVTFAGSYTIGPVGVAPLCAVGARFDLPHWRP